MKNVLIYSDFINERVSPGYQTKEKLQKEANKYKTRSEFYLKSKSAYNIASSKKIIGELFKDHLNKGYNQNKKPNNYWTLKNLQKEVNKYDNRQDFRKNNSAAYSASRRLKILDELFKNHTNKGYSDKEEWKENSYIIYVYELREFNKVYIGLTNDVDRRDKEHLFNIKSKLSLFCKENNIAYPKYKILEEDLKSADAQKQEKYWVDFYKNNGWEMFNINTPGSLGGSTKKWTNKKLQEEVNKYQTRREFYENNIRAYNAASEYKLLDILFKNHINQGVYKKQRRYWSIEKLKEESNKYKSRRKCNIKAYNMAKEYKLMDELFKNHLNKGYK